MRGPPGSGKSTLARELLRSHLSASGVTGMEVILPLARCLLLSTDDFFEEIDQETGKESYSFDFKKLGPNHERNQMRCEIAMELGVTPLIVDNTNAALWEMRRYVELAESHGYEVHFKDIMDIDRSSMSLELLKQRCAGRALATGKEIPETALERILKRYEPLPSSDEEAKAKVLAAERPQW
eukprot:CAMPEP_0171230040 /NCGR_PEP_ID=MMETSP0790-20130122/39191_1 /TAXON_ID=2925 /ORGANISM="Alexandrium catenella, Strain OF101" /LENGTH=181 /DNA_ID=CAMNT_0011696239 /DNA_START=72 /DNA_END=614 /DNA_ORIENTATION=-